MTDTVIQDPEKSLVDLMGSLFSPSKKEEAWKVISQITKEIMEHYVKVVEKEGSGNGGGGPECLAHQIVRDAASKGIDVDVGAATADIFAFIFASFTNSFAILAWTLWHIADDPSLAGKSPSTRQEKERMPTQLTNAVMTCIL